MSAEFIVLRNQLKMLAETLGELTVGSGAGATVTLDDPIAAREHIRLRYSGGDLWLEPLSTSTGTYRNGVPVEAAERVKSGDTIVVGASRLRVEIDPSGSPALVKIAITEKDAAFFDRQEPDRWVHDEVSFGRFDATRWTVWLSTALALGLIAVVVAWPTARFELIAPGPLSAVHASVGVDCSQCHSPFQGASHDACLACHSDKEAQHPLSPSQWTPHGAFGSVALAENGCAGCHREHGAEDFVPTLDEANDQCQHCHDTDRALNLASVNLERSLSYTSFDHSHHISQGQSCDICHQENRSRGRDFASVDFEACQRCHGPAERRARDLAAYWPGPEFVFSVRWHGTDDGGSNCSRCHAAVFAPEFRTVNRPALDGQPSEATFTLTRRRHDFAKHASLRDAEGRACESCHRKGGQTLLAGTQHTAPFRHALHVRELDGDDSCRECHEDVFLAEQLSADDYLGPPLTSCERCHEAGVERRNPAASSGEIVTRVDFPHAFHTTASARSFPGLSDGCVSCHVFDASNVHDLAAPTLREGVADCSGCHDDHANISGNSCQRCHPAGDRVFSNQPLIRRAAADYPHFSQNHRNFTLENCDACHENVVDATRLDFALPEPSETTCMTSGCHSTSPTSGRFHFPLTR